MHSRSESRRETATSFSHLFLRRGRIYWQKSREELLAEVRGEMEKFT